MTTFDDGNKSGIQDGIEGIISGVTITLFDGHEIVGTQISNALAGQVCFESLKPGPYQIFQAVPPSRQMTTVDRVAVDLESGQNVMIYFGSVVTAAGSEVAEAPGALTPTVAPGQPVTEEEPTTATGGGLGETLIAVSGIVILLVAAVLIGIFFIFRNK